MIMGIGCTVSYLLLLLLCDGDVKVFSVCTNNLINKPHILVLQHIRL